MKTDNVVALEYPICVNFWEGGKPEFPKKNLEAQELEINYENSFTWTRHTRLTLGFSAP